MLAMLTMRPQPRSTMPGATAWMTRKVPCTLTSNVRSHAAGSVSTQRLVRPDDAGAVDQDVDRPDRGDGRGDRCGIRDVDAVVGVRRDVERDDFDAVGPQSVGAGGAESALAAGDDRALHVELLECWSSTSSTCW